MMLKILLCREFLYDFFELFVLTKVDNLFNGRYFVLG